MKIIIFFILIFISTISRSEKVTEYGTPFCSEWNRTPSAGQKGWLMGYLSGLNAASEKIEYIPRDPLHALGNGANAFIWMDSYCRSNPEKSVSTGAVVLFFELVKKSM
jgi:hypothetical protein